MVETVARIRRAHFVQGKSIKAVARELGLARNMIRRVLRIAVIQAPSLPFDTLPLGATGGQCGGTQFPGDVGRHF